jgi:ERCC4-type nuclease
VERKSLNDLISSLTGGKLRYAVGDLATLPRAAVVVEDRYSQIFKQDRFRPAAIADGMAELQVRWPTVPIVFAETRQLAEEWTYRYLAAACEWANTETVISGRVIDARPETAEVRAWARSVGLAVPDRGRLAPPIWAAWQAAHSPDPSADGSAQS